MSAQLWSGGTRWSPNRRLREKGLLQLTRAKPLSVTNEPKQGSAGLDSSVRGFLLDFGPRALVSGVRKYSPSSQFAGIVQSVEAASIR